MNVHKGAIQFYQHFLQKEFQKFDSKSNLLRILSFLDPPISENIKQNTFDKIEEIIPLTFIKVVVKLKHHGFAGDCSATDAVMFWINVYNMKSPNGKYKYRNFATIAIKLLAISISNAH